VKRILYYNTSFDAELAGNYTDRIRRLSAEMSVYALLAAGEDETAVCDAGVDDAYLEYLRGLSFGADIMHGDVRYTKGMAWGWSERSLHRLESLGCVCDHPPLETVKRVNNRAFGISVAKSISIAHHGEVVNDAGSINDIVKKVKFPILVKPLHGSSGMGHRVIANPREADDVMIRILAENPSGVSVESLLNRIDDYAANFILGKDGSIVNLTFHQSVTDNRGIFRGIKLFDNDDFLSRWMSRIMKSVDAVAGALHDEGYSGHAGIDFFTFRDECGEEDIHALCEINARRTMGEVARACKRTLGGKHGMLRQVPSARCGTREELQRSFGNFSYNADAKNGICVLSPEAIRFDGQAVKPALVMLYAAAETEEELSEMESIIENTTIRKKRGE